MSPSNPRTHTGTSPHRRAWRFLLAVLAGSLLLSGCALNNFNVYKLPLPGGADLGSNPITVNIVFSDVLDLVPKSAVKVNDVTVGQVTNVQLQGFKALVTVKIRSDTKLPDNAYASIEQTSLLGEKFVSLSAPLSGAEGVLKTGDEIPLDHTGRNPEVEEVLGALSLVLNGGGIAQLKSIAHEVNQTLGGREDDVRSVLTQIKSFVTTLDDHKVDIVGALTSLNRLARSIRAQQPTIDSALDELPSALKSLDSQRAALVKTLTALKRLSGVGVHVIKASKAATIQDLRLLQPVLTEFAASGDSFVNAFNGFLTYPFVDDVVGRDPQVARNLQVGDYTNLDIELDVDLSQILGPTNSNGIPTGLPTILPTILNPTVILDEVSQCLSSGSLTSKACKKVLGIPQELLQLQAECQKPANSGSTLCQALNLVPGLPSLPVPGLPSTGAGGLGGIIGGIVGNGRTGADLTGAGATTHDATYGQIMGAYAPALVTLLAPALSEARGAATAAAAHSSTPTTTGSHP